MFLIYSETETATVAQNLGASEYSYYFVLKEFRSVLEDMGLVLPLHDPETEADAVWRNAARHMQKCTLFSFAPPHKTYIPQCCPTIPVFAWEFDTLPDEIWDEDTRHDWVRVLRQTGRAITHSTHTVRIVRRALGPGYPITCIPAPVWDRFAHFYAPDKRAVVPPNPLEIEVRGRIYDSQKIELSVYASSLRRIHGLAPLPENCGTRETYSHLSLSGVIYTAVLCPMDGRKNWADMLAGFCWALRDAEDATLVLKLTHHDCGLAISAMLEEMAKLSPFRCRIILIDGYLPDTNYDNLVKATTYTVNTSHGEGQCLPMMEFMSAGKPAISPNHTGMADYVNSANGFVVHSHPEPTHWPHDPRQAYRTLRYRIDFESLLGAYQASYETAKSDPARYNRMAQAAHEQLRQHCSRATVREALRSFLAMPAARGKALEMRA
jgi:glycosyltransferase involved in cell wall biosynthesis